MFRVMLSGIIEKFREEFLLSIKNKETDEEFFDTLEQYVQALSGITPYLNFFMEIYSISLICLLKKRKEIVKALQNFLLNDNDVDLNNIDFVNIAESSQWLIDILIADLIKRQARLKEDFDVISESADDSLTPMQRMYILSKQGRNYLSGEFKTTLAPNYINMPNNNDIEKIKSNLLENKVDIVEIVEIKNLDDLLSFEMYHMLKLNLLLRKCKHCDEYFIVRGRIDIEYCDRVKEGETKPCSIIGSTRTYWGSKEGDPIYAEFQQAYKRNHSRRRVGKMTANEFYEWSEEARRLRGECEAGRMTIEEFREWLGNKR
jgi:hypothetical protein